MCSVIIGLTESGRKAWQEDEDTRKDVSIVLVLQEQLLISELFKVITGPCINPERFLRVQLSHRMCKQFTLHHEFRIDTGGQNLSKRQTVFFLLVDPMDKEHKDPDTIDLGATRLAQYMQKTWKKHQNTVIGSTSNLLKRNDLSSIRHDRTPSSFTTHSQLIVSRRLSRWKLEKSYTRKFLRHPRLFRRFPLQTIG